MKPFLARTFVFSLRFTGLQLLLAVGALLFAAYIGWELYWWNKIGLYFIKWHTHIVFTALFFGALLLLPLYVLSFFKKGDVLKKAASVALAVWLAMVVAECVLIYTGSKKTYAEERSGYYRSPFDPEPENTYHVYHKSDTVTITATEFKYRVAYNSLGFPGSDWLAAKGRPHRIIAVGDSFTEGDGAPMDSSYPALLQNILGESAEVLNAGVRGSDPVFGIKNAEDRLLPFQPDVMVQAISSDDILFDFCIRGGYERFQPDGTVKFNSAPAWEPLYAMSYSLRIFFHRFGIKMGEPCGKNDKPALIADRNRILIDVFDRYEKLAAEKGFKAVMLFYPGKWEMFRDAYDFDFSEAKRHIETLPHVVAVDVFPCYRERISSSGLEAKDFYWKIDGHHNSRGYRLLAECVAEALEEKIGH
jgi:lysophospholipase L1-like esterase